MSGSSVQLQHPVVVLDTETGGLDPHRHSLLTLAVATRLPGGELVAQHEWLVKHEDYTVTARALAINGIDIVRHDAAATAITQVAAELAAYLGRAKQAGGAAPIICGHNVLFDLGFIQAQLISEADWHRLAHYGVIDTKMLADMFRIGGSLKSPSSKLIDVAGAFGITYDAHRALADVLATADVLEHFLAMTAQEGVNQ